MATDAATGARTTIARTSTCTSLMSSSRRLAREGLASGRPILHWNARGLLSPPCSSATRQLSPDAIEELPRPRILRRNGGELLGKRQRPLPLLALHVEGGRRVDDVGIARISLERLEQRRFGLAIAAQPIEGQRQVVADAGTLRQETCRHRQFLGRLTQPFLLGEEKTQRVVELSFVRRALEALPQHLLGGGVLACGVVQGDQ